MSKGMIVLGILMFAAVTAVLYVWGLQKSMGQSADLSRILLNRCGNKVVSYLRRHETITTAEIAREIQGIKAGEFWSKKRLVVQDPKKFANQVADFLLDQQYIEQVSKGKYRLKK